MVVVERSKSHLVGGIDSVVEPNEDRCDFFLTRRFQLGLAVTVMSFTVLVAFAVVLIGEIAV